MAKARVFAADMTQTDDQKQFTVSELADDWHYAAIHCPCQSH